MRYVIIAVSQLRSVTKRTATVTSADIRSRHNQYSNSEKNTIEYNTGNHIIEYHIGHLLFTDFKVNYFILSYVVSNIFDNILHDNLKLYFFFKRIIILKEVFVYTF